MGKTVKIITDKDGRRLVVISKILFKGKRWICWDEVKEYLRQYVGDDSVNSFSQNQNLAV